MWLLLEKYTPVAISVIIGGCLYVWHNKVLVFYVNNNMCMDGLYNAVFGWSSIQTGFVFAVYGFVLGSQGTFIEKIRETTSMDLFIKYTRNATKLGFFLTFFSMPLMVLGVKLSDGNIQYYCVVFWFILFVWTFLAFVRVAYIFGFLIRPRSKPLLPG